MTNSEPWWKEPTRAQWLAFSAAWFGWVLDAFDFTVFMLVMPNIAREFGVAHVATAASIALTLLARLLGGVIAGSAADRWGRRLPLMISIVWFAACDGAVALAPSFAWVLVLRTLFGLGMGAEWTSGTTLAMESWPERSRGIASGILQGSWGIGYLLAAAASAVVLPLWGWRALFVVAAFPALLVLPIRFGIVESDDWKRSRGTARPARRVLDRRTLGKLVWSSAAMAFGFGAYYGLAGLYPTLLKVELGAEERTVAWLVALFNVGMLAGSVACGILAARRGVAFAIVLPALASLAALPLYVGAVPSLLGVGAVAGGALGVGFCGVVPMLLTGMFEADVRARFVGVVYHVGAAFAAFVPMATAALAAYAGIHLARAIGIVAGACELGLVVVVLSGRRLSLAPPRTTRSALPVVGLATLALLSASCADRGPASERLGTTAAALDAVASFGPNPGNLAMYRYTPTSMPQNAPLVVVLHGCTQTADDMAGAGWNGLADKYGFYVLYPQQQAANNPEECFNWFGAYNNPIDKTNITRGQGENESIKEMVDKMKSDLSIDASRVYVVGFSSGGAMAAVMLAAWPDVFTAGGIDAGIPYNCPSTSNTDVFMCMNPGKVLQPSDWGQRVTAADPGYAGPYPRVSIWQGTMDFTVNTTNEGELVKQWTDVHGISNMATGSDMVAGYPHSTFADANGNVVVESYQVTGMAHGYATDPSNGCGAATQFLPDQHICTAYYMASFFGLLSAASADGGSPPAVDGGAQGNVDGGSGSHGGADAGHPPPRPHDAGAGTSGPANGAADGDAGWGSGPVQPSCQAARTRRGSLGQLVLVGAALLAGARRRRSRRSTP